jgi:protein-disulfide isomerase
MEKTKKKAPKLTPVAEFDIYCPYCQESLHAKVAKGPKKHQLTLEACDSYPTTAEEEK